MYEVPPHPRTPVWAAPEAVRNVERHNSAGEGYLRALRVEIRRRQHPDLLTDMRAAESLQIQIFTPVAALAAVW